VTSVSKPAAGQRSPDVITARPSAREFAIASCDVSDSQQPGNDAPPSAVSEIDLDVIAADLADVETALARLDTGDYWVDEVTGEPLSEEWMIAHPTARRAPAA
jgi:RNA polymerase-binding transcription factor DksA